MGAFFALESRRLPSFIYAFAIAVIQMFAHVHVRTMFAHVHVMWSVDGILDSWFLMLHPSSLMIMIDDYDWRLWLMIMIDDYDWWLWLMILFDDWWLMIMIDDYDLWPCKCWLCMCESFSHDLLRRRRWEWSRSWRQVLTRSMMFHSFGRFFYFFLGFLTKAFVA